MTAIIVYPKDQTCYWAIRSALLSHEHFPSGDPVLNWLNSNACAQNLLSKLVYTVKTQASWRRWLDPEQTRSADLISIVGHGITGILVSRLQMVSGIDANWEALESDCMVYLASQSISLFVVHMHASIMSWNDFKISFQNVPLAEHECRQLPSVKIALICSRANHMPISCPTHFPWKISVSYI